MCTSCAKNYMPEEKAEEAEGGCFAFGTKFIVQDYEGVAIEKNLEDIKYGDKILIHDLYEKFNSIEKRRFETVVFVVLDHPDNAHSWKMSKITLEDGSSVDVTNTHMVPILTENDQFSELRAD